MRQRILTGAVLTLVVGLFVGFSYIPYVLNTMCFILSILATFEMYKATIMLKQKWWFLSSLALCFVISYLKFRYIFAFICIEFIVAVIAFLIMMLNQGKVKLDKPIYAFLISFAFPLSFRSLVEVRTFEQGLFYLILVIVATAFTDIFAHLCGKSFGKTKIFPKLSPKKTVEGSLCGIFVTCVVTLLTCTVLKIFVPIEFSIATLTSYLLILSIVGEFGDLSMSLVKRVMKIKDYSHLLPGHGGILDRFDSLLFTAPYTLIFLNIVNN